MTTQLKPVQFSARLLMPVISGAEPAALRTSSDWVYFKPRGMVDFFSTPLIDSTVSASQTRLNFLQQIFQPLQTAIGELQSTSQLVDRKLTGLSLQELMSVKIELPKLSENFSVSDKLLSLESVSDKTSLTPNFDSYLPVPLRADQSPQQATQMQSATRKTPTLLRLRPQRQYEERTNKKQKSAPRQQATWFQTLKSGLRSVREFFIPAT